MSEGHFRRLMPVVYDIRNIVKHLLSIASKKTHEIPEVDFIVDRFDRTGDKGLGYYWVNPGAFSVVENVGAVGMAGAFGLYEGNVADASVRTYFSQVVDDLKSNDIIGNSVSGLQSGGQLARYKARMSSDNFTVQVKFTIVDEVYFGYVASRDTYYAPLQAFGVAASIDNEELGGVCATVWGENRRTTPSTTVVAFLAALRAFVTSADGANIALNGVDQYAYDYEYVSFNEAVALLVLGENTLTMTISGGTVSFALNGTAVYSNDTGAFAKGRSVGLMAMAPVALVAGAYGASIPPAITSFKVWVEGAAEPPDEESGHGTEDSGAFTYTDLYHDEDGNYDPLATES